jgi:IS5 family transposase
MRLVQNPELQSGEVDISKIQFDLKSRDDIPQILRGLQHIYVTSAIREEVFKLLEENIIPEVNKKTGRPGMELWKIFVMGILRLDLNCDYDRLQELVNYHKIIRLILGHNLLDESLYHIQTLKDNVTLLTPGLLEKINQAVVKAGHVVLKKKENEALHGRCDSFAVETNVHYPTDINLLLDSMKKVIILTARLCAQHNLKGWRQSAYNVRHLKRLMRIDQNKKRVRGRTERREP